MRLCRAIAVGWCVVCSAAFAQTSGPVVQPSAQTATTTPGVKVGHGAHAPDVAKVPTAGDLLRGGYGPYRANNDLLSYALKLRVDPVTKSISGSNTVRFRMLEAGRKIQLELTPELTIDSVTVDGRPLKFERDPVADSRTFYLEFSQVLAKDSVEAVTIAYHGQPVTQGRFGCFSFDQDKEGKPWITTACEEEGASIWWPNKDQWRDEPQEGMTIAVQVPDGLMDVSNGRFEGSKEQHNGYTEWDWRVHYPINNYDVALNIGEYEHFGGEHINKETGNKETGEKTTLDYYALPEDLAKAKVQFAQVPEMLDAYEHYFGEYPFDKDGYKLIEVPYAGMEHQSAVAYGNHFTNGYYGRDWTGVGISPRFDFIIIHESGHEWFGNAITAADRSDMWIHEGWTTYMEVLYVEYRWGKADALRYVNGLKPKVHNERPIIPTRGTNTEPPQDQYFKGALMLNTLRSVIDDDAKWFADIHAFYQHFKYQNIMTEDVVAWWSTRTGKDLKPFFDEYLRHAKIPTLELQYDSANKTMRGSWVSDEPNFDMPIRVGNPTHWTTVQPSKGEDFRMKWDSAPESFAVDTDHYYVDVVRQ